MAAVDQLKTVTTPQAPRTPFSRHDVRMALYVTRREVRDSFRDWRIMIPIILLTLAFPVLMNFTAGRLLGFVSGYGAEIIATRLIPFLLLVVGFFPTSFSLVIALETFVGEKERKSLEPLLATPLTNTQLYLGKILASVVPPLSASYLGITVYLIGLAITLNWVPTWQLFAQTVLLTTVQGIVMVAGAVVISSQTTSVRASNLLASFIIVPMALLLQVEAIAMFWGNHAGLWWIIAGMMVTALVLVRMGVRVFNREELLGRDIDQLRLGWMLTIAWGRFTGRDEPHFSRSPVAWYRQTVRIVPQLRQPFYALAAAFVGAVVLGVVLARAFPFPAGYQALLSGDNLAANLGRLEPFLGLLPLVIVTQNLRVLLLGALLGTFTFGVLGILVFMAPWAVLAFLAAQVALAGGSPLAFLLATVVPHGLVELPALFLAAAAALRWQIMLIAPPPDRSLTEGWLMAGAEFGRLFVGLVLPLLVLAALIEAFVTPQVALAVYGG